MPQPQHRGEYPADWDAIAKVVKDEAKWTCVRCHQYHNPTIGYTLTVHHFDGDKANIARWNLMALCQRCHLSVQARVDPAQALMFEPSPWCIPYIAGMVEAGKTPPPATYDLAVWREWYELERGAWPHWAPCPKGC